MQAHIDAMMTEYRRQANDPAANLTDPYECADCWAHDYATQCGSRPGSYGYDIRTRRYVALTIRAFRAA